MAGFVGPSASRWFCIALLVLGCGAVAGSLWLPVASPGVRKVSQGDFCIDAPAGATASPTEPAAVSIVAQVPKQTPAMGEIAALSTQVRSGEVVRVKVGSPRPGGVTVHGLLDVKRIEVDQTTTIQFRAIYSGRFAVHFHGDDGSHFEILSISVMPQ